MLKELKLHREKPTEEKTLEENKETESQNANIENILNYSQIISLQLDYYSVSSMN